MREPAFCKCENKGADQLCGNHKAYQHLCIRFIDNTIRLLYKSKISSLQPSSVTACTAKFVSDPVGNPESRFSHDMAQELL